MENAHVALARRSFDTIESWYHQGCITQVEWEAYLAAREILRPGNDTGLPHTSYADDAMELALDIVQQWQADHK